VSVRIPREDVVRLPGPGLGGPIHLAFGPRGTITFLEGKGGLERQLWALDPATGDRTLVAEAPGGGVREGEMSLQEVLRRERLRERGLGLTRYAWSPDRAWLLLPIKGDLWIQEGLGGALRLLVEGGVQDPAWSPRSEEVSFVRDAELHVVDLQGNIRQVTTGARGTGRTHGLAEYIAQEEMGRQRGAWWSPDGSVLAYVEVDETHLPVWRIPHQGKDAPTWEDHRYPFPGAENARVALWVVGSEGGTPVRMVLPGEWEYLARVAWLRDGALLAVVQNRRQTQVDLLRLDPATGAAERIRTERSDVWVNLHSVLRPLEQEPGAFLWASEETGHQHLVQVAADGTTTPLTSGDWMVDALVGLDEAGGRAYVTTTIGGPRQRHLVAVDLTGVTPPVRLTQASGWHEVVCEPGGDRFIDRVDNDGMPPEVWLRSRIDPEVATLLHRREDPRVERLGLRVPEAITVVQRDGIPLHGTLFRPDGPGPFPLVVKIYGGPHAQRATDQWAQTTGDVWSQHLRSRGVAVLKLDGRGSARRGLAFEGALRWDMGHRELLDQIDGVRHLVKQGIADPSRVGIIGWSYGGYLSAMAVCRFPETFHAAVAGAPVTHWDGYDTHYSERYMGLPEDNAEGYAVSSVMHHVDGLRGRLLLVHGMLDENVHFRHTGRLINALVKAGKRFDLQVFPDERHAPRDEAGRLMQLERELEHLLGPELA